MLNIVIEIIPHLNVQMVPLYDPRCAIIFQQPHSYSWAQEQHHCRCMQKKVWRKSLAHFAALAN